MKDKMCCFDGDRTVIDEKEVEKIRKVIIELVENGVKKFCFLQKSKIDTIAFSILEELKKTYTDISLGLVFPNADISVFDLTRKPFSKYDFFLTDKISFKTQAGWTVRKWNYYMVDCSDYLVCHCISASGRAYDTLNYAKSREDVKIINTAEI